MPEITARDPLVACSWLLAHTSRLNLATGIVSIYSRDPYAAVNAQYALAEQSDGRFLLGLGVSHGPFVEGVLGHTFAKPAATMQRYLQAMARMKYLGPAPIEKPRTIAAGADHVCIQPLRRGTKILTGDDEKVLELLAPG